MSMAPPTLTLTAGTSGTLGVVIAGGKPTPILQQCNSANPSVASAATNGGSCQVSAIAPGTTSITAISSGGQQASSTITVLPLPPALLTLAVAPTTAPLVVGESATLVPAVTRGASTVVVAYTYASSAPSVATVSATGFVRAVAPGVSTVTVTAQGVGAGFSTTVLTASIPVTVTANPCTPIELAWGSFVTGTFAVDDCKHQDYFIDNYLITGPSSVLKVVLNASASVLGVGLHVGSWRGYTSMSASSLEREYFLPQGTTMVSPLSQAQTGSYQFGVFYQPEDVDGCRGPLVAGSIVTLQSVTNQSCRFSTADAPFDRFLLYAPGQSCTITMKRVAGAGSIPDPYIELGPPFTNTVFAQNDDMAQGNIDAQLTLSNCLSPAGIPFELRAFGWNGLLGQRGGTGAYQLTVTYGPPA
jgi:hypothetical protein